MSVLALVQSEDGLKNKALRHKDWVSNNRARHNQNKRNWYAANTEKCRNQVRDYYITHPAHYLMAAAKRRAKRKGLEFDLVPEDIIIPEYCPILGIPLQRGVRTRCADSPSLDRIDNAKGYVRGNIAVISARANTIKNDATIDELKMVVKYCEQALRHG